MGLFARKIFNLRREKIRGCFVSSILVQKSTSRLARNTHHTGTYLRRLKETAIPHLCPAGREYQSSCVCVPPGGTPEGILDVAEYIVRLELFSFSLFSYFIPEHHFFFGEKTDVANVIVAPREEKKSTEERERLLMHRQTDRQTTVTVVLMKEKSSPKKKQNNGRRRTEEEKKE